MRLRCWAKGCFTRKVVRAGTEVCSVCGAPWWPEHDTYNASGLSKEDMLEGELDHQQGLEEGGPIDDLDAAEDELEDDMLSENDPDSPDW